jgi:hypothetical protein
MHHRAERAWKPPPGRPNGICAQTARPPCQQALEALQGELYALVPTPTGLRAKRKEESMGERRQHGRKPRKHFHRRTTAQVWEAIRWPDTGVVPVYDGEPEPLSQGTFDSNQTRNKAAKGEMAGRR